MDGWIFFFFFLNLRFVSFHHPRIGGIGLAYLMSSSVSDQSIDKYYDVDDKPAAWRLVGMNSSRSNLHGLFF